MLEFKVNIVQIVIMSSMVSGLIFCFLLLRKKENKKANPFLALLLFAHIFTVFISFVLEFGLYNIYPWLHWLPFTMTYWIGPSFYFYIRNLIDTDFEFGKSHLWHFSLIALNYLHSVYHLIYGRTFPHPLFHNFTEAIGTYALISVFIYLGLSYKRVTEYQKLIVNQLSTTDDVRLGWVKQLIRVLSGAFLCVAIFKMVDYKELIDFTVESSEGYLFPYRDFIGLLLALTTYWLSFAGYSQLQTIGDLEPLPAKTADNRDYSAVTKRLHHVMDQEKLYLDPGLNLKMLSEKANLPQKDISVALNQYLNKNFYYFVNEYRVKEVKKRLNDPQYAHLKILSIAFDCGFNSKPTFNRIFKEFTNKSPKDYRPVS